MDHITQIILILLWLFCMAKFIIPATNQLQSMAAEIL